MLQERVKISALNSIITEKVSIPEMLRKLK
jgi:hypothetical protein